MKYGKVTLDGQVEAFFLVISEDFQGFGKVETGMVSEGDEKRNSTNL